jgi:hypothetical protein
VATKCPTSFYICRTHGRPVEPALELLISNSGSRASVVPALAERVSIPLISIRTLRGKGFSSSRLGAARGPLLLGKGPGHLMPTVVVEVVRCGRAFSGTAAARVMGDVGRRT